MGRPQIPRTTAVAAATENAVNQIPGVVCNGLFIGLADQALVGRKTGVETLRRRR